MTKHQDTSKGSPAARKKSNSARNVHFPLNETVRKLRRERMGREMQKAARMAVEGAVGLSAAKREFETIMVELALSISNSNMKVAGVLLEIDSDILPLLVRQARQWRKQQAEL
jgi:hypothetical protein